MSIGHEGWSILPRTDPDRIIDQLMMSNELLRKKCDRLNLIIEGIEAENATLKVKNKRLNLCLTHITEFIQEAGDANFHAIAGRISAIIREDNDMDNLMQMATDMNNAKLAASQPLQEKIRDLQAKNATLKEIKRMAYEACCTGDQDAELECIRLCEKFDKP